MGKYGSCRHRIARLSISALWTFFKSKWKSILVTVATLGIVSVGSLLLIGYIRFYKQESQILNDLRSLKAWLYGREHAKLVPPILILDKSGHKIGEYLVERHSRMTISACDRMKWLPIVTVSAEDKEFSSHSGISYRGILRAFFRNLMSLGIREGGGTITQQLARNLFTDRREFALMHIESL